MNLLFVHLGNTQTRRQAIGDVEDGGFDGFFALAFGFTEQIAQVRQPASKILCFLESASRNLDYIGFKIIFELLRYLSFYSMVQ